MSWFRDPLYHFLLAGSCLFLIYNQINPESAAEDSRLITVDQNRLTTYMQFRARAFDPQRVQQELAAMDDNALAKLVDDYALEEALYREAKALQLDSNDYVARLRLIQQLEYTLRGFIDQELVVSTQDLDSYWAEHQDAYTDPAKITFTHVFFSRSRHGDQQALTLATKTLSRLNGENTSFEQAGALGDRFAYHLNYVDRSADIVASQFGKKMAEMLFTMNPSDSWQGPVASDHGYHLVLLTRHTPSQRPTLDEVREQVLADARQAMIMAKLDDLKREIAEGYQVETQIIAQRDRGAN